jgi:DNA gyrase subunit A
MPYQVNKARLSSRSPTWCARAHRGHRRPARRVDRQGIRVVIELKRDAVPEVVLNNLYKLTQLQTTFGVIMLALVNGQPRALNLKAVLQHFLDHRREVVVRRAIYDLARPRPAPTSSRAW